MNTDLICITFDVLSLIMALSAFIMRLNDDKKRYVRLEQPHSKLAPHHIIDITAWHLALASVTIHLYHICDASIVIRALIVA